MHQRALICPIAQQPAHSFTPRQGDSGDQ